MDKKISHKHRGDFGEFGRRWLAGGIAGAVSRTTTAPLDRLKIVMQVQTENLKIFECWQRLVREDGVRGMWRGNTANVLKITPETGMKFAVYSYLKPLFLTDEASVLQHMAPSTLAATIAQTTIYPLEVVKTQIVLSSKREGGGIISTIRQICRVRGIAGFYRGYTSSIVGFVPYHAIELSLYQTMRKYFADRKQHGASIIILCSCTASLLGQAATYPLSVVKTRLQAQVLQNLVTQQHSRKRVRSMLRDIWSQEGLPGLYRGLTANNIKVLPAVAITYLVYEAMSNALGVGH